MRLIVEGLSKTVLTNGNERNMSLKYFLPYFHIKVYGEKPSLYKTLHISSENLPTTKGKTRDFGAYSAHAALCVYRPQKQAEANTVPVPLYCSTMFW